MRPIAYLVCHHSLTFDGPKLSWEAIRRYHVDVNKWLTWGYHIGIEQVEASSQVLIGRPWTMVGAHAPGRNRDSLGICLVGDFDAGPVPPAQWAAAVSTTRWLCELFAIPTANVIGHREATAGRTCPGRYFDIDAFRRAVAGSQKTEE